MKTRLKGKINKSNKVINYDNSSINISSDSNSSMSCDFAKKNKKTNKFRKNKQTSNFLKKKKQTSTIINNDSIKENFLETKEIKKYKKCDSQVIKKYSNFQLIENLKLTFTLLDDAIIFSMMNKAICKMDTYRFLTKMLKRSVNSIHSRSNDLRSFDGESLNQIVNFSINNYEYAKRFGTIFVRTIGVPLKTIQVLKQNQSIISEEDFVFLIKNNFDLKQIENSLKFDNKINSDIDQSILVESPKKDFLSNSKSAIKNLDLNESKGLIDTSNFISIYKETRCLLNKIEKSDLFKNTDLLETIKSLKNLNVWDKYSFIASQIS